MVLSAIMQRTLSEYPLSALGFAIVFMLAASVATSAATVGPKKKKRKLLPGDQLKDHEEVITQSEAEYRIEFSGKVDGTMSRSPIGYAAYHQGFQPNIRMRLENLGVTDVVNPLITVNGKRNWRTVQDIVREARAGYTTDREKAMSIWHFQQNHRFHACTWDAEVSDPVKMFNVYGYTLCGNDSHVLADLFRTAGLRTRRGYPIGHSTTEVFFDGQYHLLDGDEGIICLLRDNKTIASEAEIVRDHDLMKRTHTYNILSNDSRRRDEFSASLHWYEGERKGEKRSHINHTMDFTLRPGEWIEWRWDHRGKQYTAGHPIKPGQKKRDGLGDLLSGWGERAYDKMRNGRIHYVPDLRSEVARHGLASGDNVQWSTKENQPALHPAQEGKPAYAVWKVSSPYVIVGGQVSLKGHRGTKDALKVELSANRKNWQALRTEKLPEKIDATFVFDDRLSSRKKPQYEYFIRVEMVAAKDTRSVGLSGITFDTDVQMSALHLPELVVGTNSIRYRDQTDGNRRVRITREWIERTTVEPPTAPSGPEFPADGHPVEGTKFTFRWKPPPGQQKITDYQFQLSEYGDMRWPLSSNFNRLVSLTADRGKTQWTIPFIGLLNPKQTYYWRVRAKSDEGIWGTWSETWSFRCRAPGVPLEVKANADAKAGTVKLTWKANPVGTNPTKYKVYASNEKGFTASDVEYQRFMGRGFCLTMEEFKSKSDNDPGCGMVETPPNLFATVEGTEVLVVGPGLNQPNSNLPYYRVVAVDESGLESGPSDYAAAPRPFIFSLLPGVAKAGEPFLYKVDSLYSIGHLTCFKGYNAAYWDREILSFSVEAPNWLKVNEKTGEVSGTPAAAGEFKASIKCTNNQGGEVTQTLMVNVR
jgi:hypothetical protein